MIRPDDLEAGLTLRSAAARLDELRMRQALAPEAGKVDPDGGKPLDLAEALELLALVEVVVRKAGYGRHSTVRLARAAGASWTQIGQAMGTTKQSAWETHNRWISEQVRLHEASGFEGMDEVEAFQARAAADEPDQPTTSEITEEH